MTRVYIYLRANYSCCELPTRKKTNRCFSFSVPPKIMPFSSLTNLLQEGNRAGITCQAVEGDLPINFRWEKSDPTGRPDELPVVPRRTDEYTSILTIEQLSRNHSGNYTCIAQNSAGEEKLVVPVTVNGKPSIKLLFALIGHGSQVRRFLIIVFWILYKVPPHWGDKPPKDISVSAGKDVMLDCEAEGFPVPTIVWKKAIGKVWQWHMKWIFLPTSSRRSTLINYFSYF